MEIINILIISGAFLGGIFLAILVLRGKKMVDIEKTQEKAEKMLSESKSKAEGILNEAKEKDQARKKRALEDEKLRQELLNSMEKTVANKQESINKKEEKTKELKAVLTTQEKEISALEEKVEKLEGQTMDELAKTANQNRTKVKEDLINKMKKELEHENGEKLQSLEDQLKEGVRKKAERIVVNAIQRLTSATSVERRLVNVKIKQDKAKGKIVGKGGKNIQYFETALGVDVIFNDQPNTISISAFNLVNRKIAERAMKILAEEKREINKQVIDQAIAKASKATDDELLIIGRKGAESIGIKTDDKELLRIIGRLQYRTSYGQNIMRHSLEVGWLAIMMGSEVGLNENALRKGGFLHDLGKAIDQNPDVQGTHDFLTKELMEKHGFQWEEIHAAWTHHDAIPLETAEAMIVKAADAISASRPGARQESMDKYIVRLKALEGTAGSFSGVKKAFAISAGRELRVFVYPEEVNDIGVQNLATDIAGDVEENITYPGHVKINVIRRTRATEFANKRKKKAETVSG